MQLAGSSRKITVIILGILTVVLLVVAILIGVRIQQSQAPTGASAATCVAGYDSDGKGWTACGPGTLTITSCSCPTATGGAYPACVCNSNCSTQSITLAANESHHETVAASCGTAQKDFGGTATLPFGSGVCAGAGQACSSSSSSSSSGTSPSICGGSCNSTSDCAVSQFGFQPICQAGKCVNPICPTDYNANPQCACKTNSGKCGDKCGNWSDGFHPLCGAGSTCSWINGPTCSGTTNLTYCMPITLHNGYTQGSCSGQQYYAYLIDPSGAPITTQAQILAACAPDPVCGDGVKNGTEECDPTAGSNSCTGGLNCSATCKCTATPVCGSACTVSADCPTGNSCNAGKCEMTGCTGANCTNNNCTPLCGGPCDPASPLCPAGNSCDATTKKCVLTACVGNASCTNNNCTNPALPNTAIVSDNVDRVLVGALLLITGAIAIKFKWVEQIEDYIVALNGNADVDSNVGRGMVRRSRNKFEEEFEDKK